MFHFHVGLRLNSLGIPIPALIQIFIRNIHCHFHEYDIYFLKSKTLSNRWRTWFWGVINVLQVTVCFSPMSMMYCHIEGNTIQHVRSNTPQVCFQA